jgi:alpha/beta superfamily hydrolase
MDTPITNPTGERLDYSFAPGAGDARVDGWLVVLGHGVTGDKDRPIVADTATALTAAGFDTLRVSFAGNGDSEGDFRACTITKEVADLGAVLNVASVSYANIAYIGHSMGAAVGVLRTSTDDRIKRLISLAGMVDTKTFAGTEFGDEIPDQGVMWEEEDCPLASAYLTDLTQTVVNVSPAAETVSVPWLLVHGTADDVVRPADTEHIQSLGKSNVETAFIEGADHGFNDHKEAATTAVTTWLKRHTV